MITMDSNLIQNLFNSRTIVLPGGKDKDGHPILIITVLQEAQSQNIIEGIRYLLSIFSEESSNYGITILLDAQKGSWKVARLYIRQINKSLTNSELAKLIVIRPDAFWDKQRVENCTSNQSNEQLCFTPLSRLNRFVEQAQLPIELGGCYIYNHEQWLENRLKIDEYLNESKEIIKKLDDFHALLKVYSTNEKENSSRFNIDGDSVAAMKAMIQKTLENGQELLKKIEYDNRNRKYASESDSMSTPQDITDTIKYIDEIIKTVQLKQNEIDESWKEALKRLDDVQDLNILIQGIVNVTNWILGPAENLLNSHYKVGCDVASAEELRHEHEAIELQCWDTYGAYAELLFKINTFLNTDIKSSHKKDVVWQKDFMDFVCRSFATRLERRRNILINSLRFFRLVSEYFDKTSEVFESLIMGNKFDDFSIASNKLKNLLDSQQTLDAIEVEVIKEGEKLADMLSMPIKDAFGRELAIDYSEDIISIRDILDATTARKNLFSDSVELQKLTLEQFTHISAYEKDVEQAIQWLDELFRVLLQYHGHVGITVYEIQNQKFEQESFQETAKETFNYGYQLLNASLTLRQSCKLSLDEHSNLVKRLHSSWEQLLSISQEQMTRLRVSAVFHRSVEEHCNQLRDLREAVATMPLETMSKKQIRVRNFYSCREKLLLEVGRIVRLGKLLRSRLKEPLSSINHLAQNVNFTDSEKSLPLQDSSVLDNVIAIEAVTEKLTEVTDLAEELDQALRSAQQDCGLFTCSSVNTSTSTTPTTIISMDVRKSIDGDASTSEDTYLSPKTHKQEELRSDEEFLTASECTLQHSRSSSYNTASECEHRYSPWWENDKKDVNEHTSKEKMVLAVGLPELPAYNQSVYKSNQEIPPGKIVREVTETTHLKVQHSHTMGVASYVLTSEISKDNECNPISNEKIIRLPSKQTENVIPIVNVQESNFLKNMKEVSSSCDDDPWNAYTLATKQAIKGCL